MLNPLARRDIQECRLKELTVTQGLGYAEFRTSTVSRSKRLRKASGSRRIPYQRFVTVPLSMPRIGARLGSSRCGGYGVALGIAPRTEDLIRENPNNLIITTVMMAATTVAVRMFRFIHCYGNITIADGRDGAGNSFAPCNALPKGSRPKAAFCVLIKIKGGKKC